MNMKHPALVNTEVLLMQTEFGRLREKLLESQFDDRRKRPILYWSKPDDRRLPMALIDSTVDQLLSKSFEELCLTRGIGVKKLRMLLELLERAIAGDPQLPEPESSGNETMVPNSAAKLSEALETFNSRAVTEGQWAKWKTTVARHRLNSLPLGRLARNLIEITSVIWNTPLGNYLAYSLEELRQLRTYGEKRVSSILEVFYTIDLSMSAMPEGGHLILRLEPRYVHDVETAIFEIMSQVSAPQAKVIQHSVITPILTQLRLDMGDFAYDLVRDRVGAGTKAKAIREQSEELGLTRARLYQVLEECALAAHVRWPQGRVILNELMVYLTNREGMEKTVRQLHQLIITLYPSK
ncbi:MAG: hypothetical protein JNL67_03570 [Planctomycetaceae bacterium]|nr:hypothetical protein [Planctomycetaceae bacterium]